MKALILGHEGQVGHHLTNYLRDHNHIVEGLDIAASDAHEWTDLRVNWTTLDDRVTWADIVFFLAFDVGGSQYLKEYQHSYEFIENNVNIMDNVFSCLKVNDAKFIFASSQMSNMNHSPYGVLKRLGEFYTRALNGVNVKFWNVYGIETDPEKFHVITDFINMAKAGEIRMRTTGHESRQFLYADDCSKALAVLAKQYDTLDKTLDYDISTGDWITIKEVAKTVQRVVNPKCNIIYGTALDAIQGIQNEPNRNINGLWHPDTSLEEGIRKIYGRL